MTRPTPFRLVLPAACLVAGLSACSQSPAPTPAAAPAEVTPPAPAAAEPAPAATIPAPAPAATATTAVAEPAPTLAYAEVIGAKPVTRKETRYGTVTAVRDVTEPVTAPKEICADVEVQERQPEKDGNAGGTVAGAVIGGVIGSQVGKGDGKKAATVAGAVIGGVVGNKIDKAHEGGKVVTRTERQCHTEQVTENKVVAHTVDYRLADGSTGSQRLDTAPDVGSRLSVGESSRTVGYDVTYRYEGRTATVRMDHKPGDRLPVIDGQVVTQSQPTK